MTSIVSAGGFITSVLLLSLSPVAGLIGDSCTVETPCPPDEICGTGGTCECKSGFAAIGNTCGRECVTLTQIDNGNITILPNTETVEFEAIYTCIDGYELEGQPKRRCQKDTGTWEGSAPNCRKKLCSPLDQPNNGTITLSDGKGLFGSIATYTCFEGFELSGDDSTRACKADGQWSGAALTCEEIINPCSPNPCATDAGGNKYQCVQDIENSSAHVCICPVGKKGVSCSEDDPPLTCREFRNKHVRFENNPTLEDRTACMPNKNSSEENVCYNPDEDIVYDFDGTDDISVDNSREGRFCLTYKETPPEEAKVCINITAFEADDIQYRPWINTTFEFCFNFNAKPRILPLPTSPLRYNAANMPETVTVQLQKNDPDVNQSHIFDISAVDISEFEDKFSIDEDTLVITNPSELHTTYPNIFGQQINVEITVTDNGVPALENTLDVKIEFVYEQLICTVPDEPFLVHLDPMPSTTISLGQIQCTANGETQTPEFEIMNDAGPVIVGDNGTIFYDPTAAETNGKFVIDVRANITLTFPVWTTVKFVVLARNFYPKCTRTDKPLPIYISEKAEVGTCGSDVVFTCDDPANLTKSCTDDSDSFEVQCVSVSSNITEIKVCSSESLDDLAGSTETVTVEVENKYGSDIINISVTITNVNEPPSFLIDSSQIDIEIPEDIPLFSLIGEVLAVTDPDMEIDPPDDTLSVTLTDLESKEEASALPFSAAVNSFGNTVNVTLEKELTPKVRNSYLLELKVEDSEGEFDTVDLNITIKDINEKPTCESANVTTSATVRDPVGYIVTRVSCIDSDFSLLYSSLSYSLEGETTTTEYFKIDSDGAIQLKQQLTAFTSGTQLSFTVRITDGGGLSETIQIIVDVKTSYPPECETFEVTKEKSERTNSGECVLLVVNCKDPVQAETLSFEGLSGNGTQLFTLKTESTTNDNIAICTADSLDGKVGDWQINLVVSSSYGSRNIKIIMKVLDVNNQPTCTSPVNVDSISVKSARDAVVATLFCNDPDVDSTFKTLTYTLEGEASVTGYFKMDSNVIKLDKPLHDVTGTDNILTFKVRAEDGGGLFSTISVTVTVQNDFPPVCSSAEYEVTKSETTDIDVCFGVDVECVESVRNETLTYTLTSGNGTELFNEKGSTNSQMTVCTLKALQGLYGTWKMEVLVTSSYGETKFSIIIRVSDKNDSPVFSSSVYTKSVFENTTTNTVVLTLQATDQDSGAYGRITYHSTDLENSGVFSLNMDSGEISVVSTLDADKTTTEWYYFVVKAIDGASVPLSATTTVSIQVVDVNDEVPVCNEVPAIEPIELLSPVDTVITQLQCSDADKTVDFRKLVYTTSSSYFNVNSTGHIILISTLPRDVTKHTIVVKVGDSDKPTDPDFTTTTTVTVYVNNKVPPVCTPESIVRTLKEIEEIDVCIDKEVICTDPTGGDLTLESQSGTALDEGLLVIKIHEDPGKLGLSACISSSLKDKFKTYELYGTVSNGLSTTTVRWTLTVENVNEFPVFSPDVYNITVPENQTLNTEILKVNVVDPDDGKNIPAFELKEVTAESSNDADFGKVLSDSIWFLGVVKSFYALRAFNATQRDVYKYVVSAVDKSGLKSKANVTIWIDDINSAPICEPSTIEGYTNILAKENSLIVDLFCYDTDLKPEYIRLDYQIVAGDEEGYFSVTPNGELIVQKSLPRELLYGTGNTELEVKISDRGTPPLSTGVTVIVTVDNKIPATCKPVIIPPNIWVLNSSVTIQMDCTDPTKAGTQHLKYDVSGNFTYGFTEISNALGTIVLRYDLITSGVFQITVSVNNDLDLYAFSENIIVSYSKASPVFSKTKYTDTISEVTLVNTIVMIVDASSANPDGKLEYNVIGGESTVGWANYFSVDINTGVIRTLAIINELANKVVTLKVEAVDTVSKLRSSVPVEIIVEDINEPPSCLITSTALDLEVNAAVGSPVIQFVCNDPDVKDEFRKLTYTITVPNAGQYFELVGDPPLYVAVKTPLNVLIKEYVITFTVSDDGVPPLKFTRDFDISVNILPPPVDVKVSAVSFDTITVTWNYARADYFDVTNSFKVKALSIDNIIVKESPDIDPGTLTYNITGLEEKTQYVIVVETVTGVGTRSSKELAVTTEAVPSIIYFMMTMVVLEKEYNERLRDEFSQIYNEYKSGVIENVDFVLRNTPGYIEITNVTFRPHNSIFADIKGTVNQLLGKVDDTIQKLNETVSTGWVRQLSVQSDYFQASAGDGYIIIDGLNFTPANVYNGGKVELQCNITAIGYPSNENFTYWWTFRRIQLQPTSQSRYSVAVSTDPVFYEYKHSTLGIDPVLTEHSGLYGCHVRDSANQQVKEKLIEMRVTSQPVLYITPKSLTVRFGENVNVTCGLAVSPGTFQGFKWFKNGNLFQGSSNEIISLTSTTTTMQVRGIQQNVVFGCEGSNEAGNSQRVNSSIGVFPQDPSEGGFCQVSNDGRGTTWPESAADTIVSLECDTDFTGEIYRPCTAQGVWNPPVYNCVRKELKDIEKQVIAVQDGSTRSNLTEVLVELNRATADKPLYEGDIDTTINTLGIAAGISESSSAEEKATRTSNFIETCSSLIDDPNIPAWRSSIEVRKKGAISIPKLVEDYNDRLLDSIPDNNEDPISVKNIHIILSSGRKDKYVFPDRSSQVPDWVSSTKTEIVVQGDALIDLPTVRYAGSFFRNITPILVKRLKKDGVVTDVSSSYDINSDIIAFHVKDSKSMVIDPPAMIKFQHFDSNYSEPVCCYWNFEEETFATDGCSLVSTDDEFTVCQCNHFTNFAVLMSPGRTPEADVMALSIISAVGCALSILCLLLTIILYALVWRLVKSDRAVLLIHLCVALIISYVIFLAGVDRAENKNICTAIAALLHYFYLVVFFLMLAYGVEIAISVVYVFVTRSRIRWLLPLAWGIPLVIVGISMGVTQLDGYGNERFCWLSTDDGLLWAFVGPAALVILINFIIVIVVLRQMFKSSAMMTKSDKEKAVTGVRSICVLLPILGLTWVFGVFSVNEDLVVFQYIFAICNTLQGFFIFVFHCFFNKQLKQALKQRSERKKSLATLENTFKNQHSTTGSTGYTTSETKLNQNIESNIASSNPFLEADRQMKELVGKNKKAANINDNFEANNKIEKNNKVVDLDDVKISNIIRESEVMGGVSGVSSILQVDDRDEGDKHKEAPTEASRHRYDYIDPYQADSAPTPGIQKPPGYEKLLQGTSHQGVYASKDSVHSGNDRSKEREKEKQRGKEREKERELEQERQKRIEKEKRERFEKEKIERERMEKENEERERREREQQEREQREREQRERDRYKDRGVIRIGFTNEGFSLTDDRKRDGSHDRRVQPRSGRSSRTDDDYESGSSAQNITSISTALPEKFELYQGKKRKQKEAKKQAESSLKKKDKKKSSLKDRSKAYEYSYDSTYLGGQSRHASLESMNMQNFGYSPYAQVPGYAGYQTGRPAIQQQHWDQYAYARGPRDPRDSYDPYSREPYRRDYW